jgi:predicted secreted protein
MPLCAGFDSGERPVRKTLILGQPLYLSVEEDRSTEFRWKPVFNKRFLRLKQDRFTPDKSLKKGSRSARNRKIGRRVFVFVPIRTGNTRVALNYRHPDEESPADTRKVELKIVPQTRAPAQGTQRRRRGGSGRPMLFSN